MDFDIDKKLAFIVGHYKSGSTWLLNLLSLHPDICGTGEAHLFRYAWSGKDFQQVTEDLYKLASWGGRSGLIRHRIADWTRPVRGLRRQVLPPEKRPRIRYDLSLYQQYKLYRGLCNCQTPEEYCSFFFNYLLHAWKPRQYLVEKTPNNIYYLDKIKQLFPESKLIAIYRDGRDFVVSHKFYIENKQQKWDLKKSINIWKKAIQAQIENQQRYQMVVMSYEELHNIGKKKTEGLLDYLDLSYDDYTVYEMLEKSSFKRTTGRQPGQEKASNFYRKGVVGDWKNHFSEEDKVVFKEMAGELLIELEYENDYDW